MRANLGLLYLMHGRAKDARKLADDIRLDRQPNAKAKGMYAAVCAEAFARTGKADEAMKLLDTYKADDPEFGDEKVNNKDHLTLVTADLSTYVFGSFYGGHPTPVRANPFGAGLFTRGTHSSDPLDLNGNGYTDDWFRTGDLGRIDSKGRITVVARHNEVISDSAGRRIFPRPIEDAIKKAPGILDAAVVGLPAGQGGERVAVLLVGEELSPADGESEDAYLARCRAIEEQLAAL